LLAWTATGHDERSRGQHQFALGDGDEVVAQTVEPELGPARLADAGVEMMRVLDMAGRAGRRWEHPVANAFGQIRGGGSAAFEYGCELIGDGKLQGHARLGLLDAEGERVHVDPLPAQRQHLVPAHAGVEPEPESIADRRVVDLRLDTGTPARQYLRRRRNLAPRFAVKLAAAGEPEIDRVAQPVMVDTGPAVDRAQQGHRPVGGRPSMVGSDAVESGLDIRAADGVERAGEPVTQIPVGLVAVEIVGPLRAVGVHHVANAEDDRAVSSSNRQHSAASVGSGSGGTCRVEARLWTVAEIAYGDLILQQVRTLGLDLVGIAIGE